MDLHAPLRDCAKTVWQRIEEALDALFGGVHNPLRHLGALGLYLLWIVVGSGLYLYTVLDIGIEQVYSSINDLSAHPWHPGGLLRSLHRYASDGFILVMALHLVREWAYGRYTGFRFYSWLTGIPLIWLAFVCGIGGYWIVWDQLAQFSATASTELLDWLPLFSEPSARNFLTADSMTDRFFTLVVFIHLGAPILLILGLWAHVHRISRVDYLPSRQAMLATAATLVALALMKPAVSDLPANLAQIPAEIRLDWFLLFIHPLTDLSSPAAIWCSLFGATALLFALPFLSPRRAAAPVAVVDPANCNGCSRCLADCPYAAITLEAHPTRRGYRLAVVDAGLCASCGLCAGACPSSTPFRSQEHLVTGIDMPQQPLHALRQQLESALAGLRGEPRIVVFGCDKGARVEALAAPDTAAISLICAGMLPPSFVEYALRCGADGVLIATCRSGGCEFRLGERWIEERLTRRREPHLRGTVPADRLRLVRVSANDGARLARALRRFRSRLQARMTATDDLRPYLRRTPHHA